MLFKQKINLFFNFSFQWYLETIYPELFIPTRAVFKGNIHSAVDGLCLSTPRGKKKDMLNKSVLANPCKKFPNPLWNVQVWHLSGHTEYFKIYTYFQSR